MESRCVSRFAGRWAIDHPLPASDAGGREGDCAPELRSHDRTGDETEVCPGPVDGRAAVGMAEPIDNYLVTSHAAFEISRRGIKEALVRRILAAPEQRHAVRPGRDVLQSRLAFAGKTYLLRVFVDIDRDPAEVVTVYRTSRIAKYWRA